MRHGLERQSQVCKASMQHVQAVLEGDLIQVQVLSPLAGHMAHC
jgi:hypothetical protein